MNHLDFTSYPFWVNAAAFALSAAFVWEAGTRLSRYVDAASDKAGIGKAFMGLLLLGGITSLPEIATVSTASYAGNVPLAVNNLLGSVATNVLILAIADAVYGKEALTSVVPDPAVLLHGTLDMVVLATVAGAIVVGDVIFFGVGVWSTALLGFVVFGMWLSSKYREREPWIVGGDRRGESKEERNRKDHGRRSALHQSSLKSLLARITIAAAVILVAGYVLAKSGDAIATQTGLGASLIGFVLVGLGTSLPEVSSVVSAVRLKQYGLAVGDIFGTNLFNIALLFLADAVYVGGERGDEAVLGMAGRFESFAVIVGLLLTGVYLIGLLERQDRTVLGVGYDSWAVVAVYFTGLAILYTLQ